MSNKIEQFEDGMTTDAGRAVLDSATDFTNEGKAVGEYVKNSWQYTDKHPNVEIIVDQQNKSIHIKDDSRGMSIDDLRTRFFVLHKRNIDRQKGKIKRGEYGTGKAAALGIGEILRVTTVHNNLINQFEIHRADCEDEIKSAKSVPIRWHPENQNKKTSKNNGTTIDIEGFLYDRPISIQSIKDFLQTKTLPEKKAYTHEENGIEVNTIINLTLNEEKIEEEEIEFSKEIPITLSDEEKKYFDSMDFTIRIADRRLKPDEQGIRIFCNGIFKAFIKTPLANKSEYIFGDCECPKLMTEKHPPIFDSNRNNQINEDNKFGSDFKRFVMRHVDIYRKELEKEDKENKKKEKDEITKKEEQKMKEFFNSIFKEQELEFQKIAAKARGNIDKKDDFVPELGESKITFGKDFGIKIVDGDEGIGIPNIQPSPNPDPNPNPNPNHDPKTTNEKFEKDINSNESKGKERKAKKKPSGGGFDFKYENIGKAEDRADYNPEERIITVNLSHPFIEKLYKASNEDTSMPKFRRGAYEAAAVEFAAAIVILKGKSNMYENTLSDGVTQMQKILDDAIRKMSVLDIFND
jgi:hypothetical protein|tara:strand:+ start:36 stop:1766 length:1731 start_codon:yes stop_codon:yes gene_type:complete